MICALAMCVQHAEDLSGSSKILSELDQVIKRGLSIRQPSPSQTQEKNVKEYMIFYDGKSTCP